jgi:hypothetical protein
MGQYDILQCLQKQPDKYLTAKEIKAEINHGHVDRCLKKLWSKNMVEVKTDFLGLKRYYKWKRDNKHSKIDIPKKREI